MYGRNEFTNTLLLPRYIFITHRNEVFDIILVQKLFQNEFPAIGDTQGIPMIFRIQNGRLRAHE